MICRLCHSERLSPVPFVIPDGEPAFVRCADCGTDSSPLNYDDLKFHYNTANAAKHCENGGGRAKMQQHCRTNTDWFGRFHDPKLPRTFLDVGSCDGAALDGMEANGWQVTGFDVLVPPDDRHWVLTAPEFKANLFTGQFAAVLSREVFEHVPDPHDHLRQLVAACLPGGLVQIQTPRTENAWSHHTYQTLHQLVAAPAKLQQMIVDAGLEIVDSLLWHEGQAHLSRKPR